MKIILGTLLSLMYLLASLCFAVSACFYRSPWPLFFALAAAATAGRGIYYGHACRRDWKERT
jgi:hypothetical protein